MDELAKQFARLQQTAQAINVPGLDDGQKIQLLRQIFRQLSAMEKTIRRLSQTGYKNDPLFQTLKAQFEELNADAIEIGTSLIPPDWQSKRKVIEKVRGEQ